MFANTNKFRFGTIAGIRPVITFPFPFFNHLKYFPGLPESIEKLNYRIKIELRAKNV